MPRISLLAALVAAVMALAACSEREPAVSDEDQLPADIAEQLQDDEEGGGDDEGGGEADETVEFTAVDIDFEDLPDSVSAGTIEFVMTNDGSSEHDLYVEEEGDQEILPTTSGGDTGSGTIELEPGTYTLYCSVPGHRDGGMEHELKVE